MTRLQELRSASTPAAVIISDGLMGPHIGLTYRAAKKKAQRIIHLAFHLELVDEPAAPSERLRSPMIVAPAIDEEELRVLSVFCAKRASFGAQDVPYGFRYVGSTFAPSDGRFVPGEGEVGLTCSTFVLAMCEWARISLIVASTWEHRPDDAAFHQKMIDLLKAKQAKAEHIAAVTREASCVRFRAEEVAAASAAAERPLAFPGAAADGAALAEEFYELIAKTETAPTPGAKSH